MLRHQPLDEAELMIHCLVVTTASGILGREHTLRYQRRPVLDEAGFVILCLVVTMVSEVQKRRVATMHKVIDEKARRKWARATIHLDILYKD